MLYNVHFILTNSVVVVTVDAAENADHDEIIKAAAEITYSVDGLDVSGAQADVEVV